MAKETKTKTESTKELYMVVYTDTNRTADTLSFANDEEARAAGAAGSGIRSIKAHRNSKLVFERKPEVKEAK